MIRRVHFWSARLTTIIAGAALPIAPVMGQTPETELTVILHRSPPADIAKMRSSCALGLTPSNLAKLRTAGAHPPSASAWCVTVLTRAGRDGTLGYARDPRSASPTPAIAFDTGFVGGYLKRDEVPSGAPAMATLLPIVERCLNQSEPNAKLCSSVGYILGTRSARGETLG